MRQVENLLRGTVTLTARGAFPERLLNLCAQEQVPCWGLEWVDEHALRSLLCARNCGGWRSWRSVWGARSK